MVFQNKIPKPIRLASQNHHISLSPILNNSILNKLLQLSTFKFLTYRNKKRREVEKNNLQRLITKRKWLATLLVFHSLGLLSKCCELCDLVCKWGGAKWGRMWSGWMKQWLRVRICDFLSSNVMEVMRKLLLI